MCVHILQCTYIFFTRPTFVNQQVRNVPKHFPLGEGGLDNLTVARKKVTENTVASCSMADFLTNFLAVSKY